MDVVDLQPLTDAQIDKMGAEAAHDLDLRQIAYVNPRKILRLLAEVKKARLAALTDADRAALMTVRDLVVLAQATCVGRPEAVRGHEAATRGIAVLDRLLGIGGS